MMERILHINDYPIDAGGGAEVVMARTIALLRQRGLHVDTFTSADLGNARRTPWRYVDNGNAREMLAEMLAASCGFGTYNLGTDVPLEELLEAAVCLKPSIVVIGLTYCAGTSESATIFAAGLDAGLPRGTEILLGGSRAPGVAAVVDSKRVAGVSTLEEFNRICSHVAMT